MSDEISTKSETETVEDTATQEIVDTDTSASRELIDNMSDDEFEDHLTKLGDKSEDEPKATDTESNSKAEGEDLEDKYKKQLEDGFELNEPVYVKVSGHVMEITDSKDIQALINKGLDYTKKTQELARDKDTLKYLEDNGINDINTLQQVLSGQIQIDPTQLQQPQVTDPKDDHVNQVAEQILQSDKADEMKSIIGSLPSNVKDELSSNAQMLQGLFVDVQNGFAQKIMPLAQKYMSIDGLPFIDAYIKAGNDQKRQNVVNDEKRKVIASEPRSKGKAQKRSYTREDVYNMDEAEFEKYLDKLK